MKIAFQIYKLINKNTRRLRSGNLLMLKLAYMVAVRAKDWVAAQEILEAVLSETGEADNDAKLAEFCLNAIRTLRSVNSEASHATSLLKYICRFADHPEYVAHATDLLLKLQCAESALLSLEHSSCNTKSAIAIDGVVTKVAQKRLSQARVPDRLARWSDHHRSSTISGALTRRASIVCGSPIDQGSRPTYMVTPAMGADTLRALIDGFGMDNKPLFIFADGTDQPRLSDTISDLSQGRPWEGLVVGRFDLATDDDAFTAATELANAVLSLAQEKVSGMPGPGSPLALRLIDRTHQTCREHQDILRALSQAPSFIVGAPTHQRELDQLLDINGASGTPFVISVLSLSQGVRRLRFEGSDLSKPRSVVAAVQLMPAWRERALDAARRAETLIFLHLSDRQYAETLVALTQHVTHDVIALSPTQFHPEVEAETDPIVRARIMDLCIEWEELEASDETVGPRAGALVSAALAVATSQNTSKDVPVLLACNSIVRYAARAVSEHLALENFFSEILTPGAFRGVAVSPGRGMEPRMFISRAQEVGLKNADIQALTISRLTRFRRPTAERVTVIDRAHLEVYTDHYCIPPDRVYVTGSARIDWQLEKWRGRDRASARQELNLPNDGTRILLVATQPIRLHQMSRIVEIAMAATAEDWQVVIKSHPRETGLYLDEYETLRKRCPNPDLVRIERTGNVYLLALASDAVATYYSTVGQEAFALRRPVLVIDPFETPPSPDFVGQGMARRVTDRVSLISVLNNLGHDVAEATDPYLQVLQDGQAAERIWRVIRGEV